MFFPPLLIFPLIRGIGNFSFYQDVWQAIETYCTQAQVTRASTSTLHGLCCARCGVLNDEAAQHCHLCGATLTASPASSAGAPEQVTCASCHERVVAARFCGNCGASLTPTPRDVQHSRAPSKERSLSLTKERREPGGAIAGDHPIRQALIPHP
ncbi:zinc ribbon domain-containing protein [Thermogemmatispora aurantia]|uniref:zinc ribbon domain-containing protein n=1 Tax=Thermogemmatispora aurantia TaxID=2045279 RepID=UPI0014784F66|nr:zinc ribbon domain-containing protein [Thermogemmatispora aurantia]